MQLNAIIRTWEERERKNKNKLAEEGYQGHVYGISTQQNWIRQEGRGAALMDPPHQKWQLWEPKAKEIKCRKASEPGATRGERSLFCFLLNWKLKLKSFTFEININTQLQMYFKNLMLIKTLLYWKVTLYLNFKSNKGTFIWEVFFYTSIVLKRQNNRTVSKKSSDCKKILILVERFSK